MDSAEDPRYLSEQLITYIGNKRALLGLIAQGVERVQQRLGGRRLSAADLFSGSGIVSRFLKRFSHTLYVNDWEDYARVISACYLHNNSPALQERLRTRHAELVQRIAAEPREGFITRLYAPQDDADIRPGERAFYTHHNALFLDTARQLIAELPEEEQPFFLAPLLSEASVHTNTGGVFKGFYKNHRGIGQFGGEGRHALSRICAPITLPLPIFSRFESEVHLSCAEAAEAAAALPPLDLAYIDPPYNQHPYGSNYFMLNLLARGEEPQAISGVSGIPADWHRSAYNKRRSAAESLFSLLAAVPARFLLISYNSEGFITPQEMTDGLAALGRVTPLQQSYPTYRACRNLAARPAAVTEFLFMVER